MVIGLSLDVFELFKCNGLQVVCLKFFEELLDLFFIGLSKWMYDFGSILEELVKILVSSFLSELLLHMSFYIIFA